MILTEWWVTRTVWLSHSTPAVLNWRTEEWLSDCSIVVLLLLCILLQLFVNKSCVNYHHQFIIYSFNKKYFIQNFIHQMLAQKVKQQNWEKVKKKQSYMSDRYVCLWAFCKHSGITVLWLFVAASWMLQLTYISSALLRWFSSAFSVTSSCMCSYFFCQFAWVMMSIGSIRRLVNFCLFTC